MHPSCGQPDTPRPGDRFLSTDRAWGRADIPGQGEVACGEDRNGTGGRVPSAATALPLGDSPWTRFSILKLKFHGSVLADLETGFLPLADVIALRVA